MATLSKEANKVAADARQVANSMGAAVSNIASDAAANVSAMASQAACDLGKRADEMTASAGAKIQKFGDQVSRSAPQAGVLGNASQAVAKTVKDGGQYIESAKLSGMTADLAEVIRQNPVPAVLIAFASGWFLASKLRAR